MPMLSAYHVEIGAEPLLIHLSPAVRTALSKLVGYLNPDGRVRVDTVLKQVFPHATTTASANALLNGMLRKFNDAAQAAESPIRMEMTKAKRVGAAQRWVWFEVKSLQDQLKASHGQAKVTQELVRVELRVSHTTLPPVTIPLILDPTTWAALRQLFMAPSSEEPSDDPSTRG